MPVTKLPKNQLHGWLNFDKPLGLTSNASLSSIKRVLRPAKIGHAGTLDPLASGVLPLAFGEATKLISFAMAGVKIYEFAIRWGEKRSTDDAEGVVEITSHYRPHREDILSVLQHFVGTIKQVPPKYSAIKYQGKRAYDLARQGEDPILTPRSVEIFSFEMLDHHDGYESSFRVQSGQGMYVRALARDLAHRLNSQGYVSYLRRLAVGPFTIENSHTLKDIQERGAAQSLIPLEAVLKKNQMIEISLDDARRLHLGQPIPIQEPWLTLPLQSPLLALNHGNPCALIECRDHYFHVLRGFRLTDG